MKGISLPSNIMYYLIITLIVVTAVIILLIKFYPTGEDYFFLLKTGCIELSKNCDNKNWQNIVVEGKRKQPYTIGELCNLNNIEMQNCKKSCGC